MPFILRNVRLQSGLGDDPTGTSRRNWAARWLRICGIISMLQAATEITLADAPEVADASHQLVKIRFRAISW